MLDFLLRARPPAGTIGSTSRTRDPDILASFLEDRAASEIAADRARWSAATLLDSVTDASVREELQTEIQRVLDGEGSAWA